MNTLTAPAEGCPSGLAPAGRDTSCDPLPFVRSSGDRHHLALTVRGARCAGCLSRIERAVSEIPGISTARLNLSTGRLDVSWSGPVNPARITDAVSRLGYGVAPLSTATDTAAENREERSLLLAMGVAGFATANIMLLSVSVWGGHGEMGEATRQGLHALSGLIALPTLIFSGRVFFRSAWQVLRKWRTNMDVPISLALILAFSVSIAETIRGGPHAYFDAACMLLFFLLIGRFLDARVRRRAWTAARELSALASRTVTRVKADGSAASVRPADVRPGDLILLAPGERAVVDMVIETGESEVDISLVTGETLPGHAGRGMKLMAGSINLSNPLTGRAISGAADSLLSEISQMLTAGEQKRSAYRQIADKAVSLYVPIVHSTALLTFLGWWVVAGAGLRESVLIAVSTLIITCPCALALAAPVVQVVAAGRLFRSGSYLKSGDALERLAACDHIIFDKTGTLTLGTPRLVNPPAGPVLSAAAALARASHHPLSRALVAAAGPGPVAANVREYPGSGLEGEVDGQQLRLGSARWTGAAQEGHGRVSLFLAGAGMAPVELCFEDDIQADAPDSIGRLRAMGLSMEIVSGDRPEIVCEVARRLSIASWTAGADPKAKAARLEALQAAGRRVLMVGDGLNDAGALALAHASAAPGGALDVSQSAADAVYASGLRALPVLMQTARMARSVMMQNFMFAAAYNLVAVPIAVMGHATPLVAAIAMSGSSLIVCLNALRINSPSEKLS